MTPTRRTANVLGALALVVNDRAAAAVLAATGQSQSSAGALSALSEFLDRPTLDELRKVLGLTPSGVVRLVDRLAESGLVVRQPGADGRSRAIVLTTTGRRMAEQIGQARLETLTALVDELSPEEQASLLEMLGRVMQTVVQQKSGGAWICRQCDLAACERSSGHCPAANAARAKFELDEPPRASSADP